MNILKPYAPFVLRCTGKDRVDFIDRLSTACVRELSVNSLCEIAFCDAKSCPVFYGYLRKNEQNLEIFGDGPYSHSLIQHLEFYQFQDEVFFTLEENSWVFIQDHMGEILFSEDKYTLTSKDLSPTRDFTQERIVNLIPWMGYEIPSAALLLELGLTHAFKKARCYPGQEVVERIRTQGQPSRFLAQLKLQNSNNSENTHQGTKLYFQDEEVGMITTMKDSLSLAILKKKVSPIGSILWSEYGTWVLDHRVTVSG